MDNKSRPKATEEEVRAGLARVIGSLGEPERVPVESLAVRRMAMAIESQDPIHFDEAVARKRGYRGIVAPWPILNLLQHTCAHPSPKFSFGVVTVHGRDSFEYFEPVIVGDVITVQAAITDTEIKQGRSGLLGLATREHRFINQDGALCAVLRTIMIRR